jgi:hypothetical protein
MGKRRWGEGISEPPYSGFSGVNSQSFPSTRQGNTWHCIVLTVQSVGRVTLAARVAAVQGAMALLAQGGCETSACYTTVCFLVSSFRMITTGVRGPMPTVSSNRSHADCCITQGGWLCGHIKTAHQES